MNGPLATAVRRSPCTASVYALDGRRTVDAEPREDLPGIFEHRSGAVVDG